MASVLLGTAGHIDHGKTALVHALTGTDTDRLKEEKARGITIELGFAELAAEGRPHFGVVDVPGHEAFVRAMVAGAAGMDIVLLVVAADEGVMPQTREHLAIVELLAVPELVVAITKCDAVEAEWLDLVEADIRDTLSSTPYAASRLVHTSAHAGTGLDELLDTLADAAERIRADDVGDLVRLPLDRVFTIQGTGTVGTGTLWSGELEAGAKVRLLPDNLSARVRSLQVHGRESGKAGAGDRVAVALTGDGGDRDRVSRGGVLVTDDAWSPTWMLTTRLELIEDTAWSLEHNQRVHVHHGTAEVLGRCVLLQQDPLQAGSSGWVQLRLEEPLVARAGDRLVIRSYSPVSTIGGGVIAEPLPPKRNRLSDGQRRQLERIIDGSPRDRVEAAVGIAGWSGVPTARMPLLIGAPPSICERAVDEALGAGALRAGERVISTMVRGEAEARVRDAVEAGHEEDSLRAAVPLARIRSALPSWAPSALADATIDGLCTSGQLERVEGGVRRAGFLPQLTPDQETAAARLYESFAGDGLAAPFVDELPAALTDRPDFWPLVRYLETTSRIRLIADGLYVAVAELDAAVDRIRSTLAGREDLGPADFRDVLSVSRKHLIPLLNHFDGAGVTVRHGAARAVPNA